MFISQVNVIKDAAQGRRLLVRLGSSLRSFYNASSMDKDHVSVTLIPLAQCLIHGRYSIKKVC